MAWDAVARTPRCMLWLEITEDGMLFSCLMSLLTPTRSSPFSPLLDEEQLAGWSRNSAEPGNKFKCARQLQHEILSHLKKINASPATNLFELTKTLQPVVSRFLLGCPERNSKYFKSHCNLNHYNKAFKSQTSWGRLCNLNHYENIIVCDQNNYRKFVFESGELSPFKINTTSEL